MTLAFTEKGWDDYLYWQQTDKDKVSRINELIKAISREQYKGIGKPEPLKGNLKGWWSRRIDLEHRLVYRIEGSEIVVMQCRFHY